MCGEISSLYTLTRFLGEGVGGHLVSFALECAAELGFRYVFACTTSERVQTFFERLAPERLVGDFATDFAWARKFPGASNRMVPVGPEHPGSTRTPHLVRQVILSSANEPVGRGFERRSAGNDCRAINPKGTPSPGATHLSPAPRSA